jgi:hypothetical protein
VSCQVLIAAVAAAAAILPGPAGPGPAPARSGHAPGLAAYDLGVAAAVRSDLGASVRLPDGGQAYLFGDTLAVNGQEICRPFRCPVGYPHDSIAIQAPGTATFTMQSCAAAGCPYGWQWVPDWPDGSYFWMAAPAVDGSSLYVIGERISQPAAAVEGEYTARFTVGAGDALTYQGITALSGAAGQSQWGSATADPGGRGWWLTGTRTSGGPGCVADCKTLDTAHVPSDALTHPPAWHVRLGVLPSGRGYDLGTVVSMSHVAGHGWVAFTKRDDITGSVLERLNSWHVTGPWHLAPGGGRPGPRPDADGPTRPRPTRPARLRPGGCSCPGPAARMTPARHATCGPSSPTCPSAHPDRLPPHPRRRSFIRTGRAHPPDPSRRGCVLAAARRQLRPARCQTPALDGIYSIGADGADLTRLSHMPLPPRDGRGPVRRRRQRSRLLPRRSRFVFTRTQA